MKPLSVFLVILGLTCIAFFPAATCADETLEDLDVTMVVIDSPGDIDDLVSRMRGPDNGNVDDDDWDDEEGDESEAGFDDNSDDGFSSDEIDEDGALEDEDDFEDGEDVDDDQFDDVDGGDA